MARRWSGLVFGLMMGCGAAAPPGPEPAPSSVAVDAVEAAPVHDRGQKAPPLPPDLPIWHEDRGPFVADHHWYGEPDWDGVRLRIIGHFGWTAHRLAQDLARAGELSAAAAVWRESAQRLDAVALQSAGPAGAVRDLLARQAREHAALVENLAAPPPGVGSVDALRVRLVALATAPELDATKAKALHVDLERLRRAPPYQLDLDAFGDFTQRHALRVDLWAAWAEASGPFSGVQTWGYWSRPSWDAELARLRGLLDGVIAARAGGPPLTPAQVAQLLSTPPATVAEPPFTVAELSALPTGDSLIDVAGEPGPRAIGTLVKMGTDDAAWMAWLEERSAALQAGSEEQQRALLDDMLARVQAHSHASRYYNDKQLRNAGLRALAQSGRAAAARELLAGVYPLHNQDWACPNREGILLALDGALALAAGQTEAGRARLRESLAQSEAFLKKVDQAARAGGSRERGGPARGKGRPMSGQPPRR